jgi:hypothetical protein
MNTEQDSLTETLRGIASGSRRTKIARLREIFDEVEAAKAAGAGNKTIVDGLAAHGLIFDVNNFKNARSRILKERAMEELARVTPATNENKSPCHSPKARKTLTTNVSVTNATESVSVVESGNELIRPAGISNVSIQPTHL